MRCDARFGGSAAYPNRRNAETPISCSTRNAETPISCSTRNAETPISCSTWNADKLLKLNNLCKIVLNVRIIRLAYSDYKLLITRDLTF